MKTYINKIWEKFVEDVLEDDDGGVNEWERRIEQDIVEGYDLIEW
jgi:hypothetical protein